MNRRGHFARFGSLPTASGGIARAAYAVATKAQLDTRTLLNISGLTLGQVERPQVRIPVQSQIKFLDVVADALHDDFLGVHLAESLELRELGLLYYVVASSETLSHALTRLTRYSAIHNEGLKLRYRQGANIYIEFEYAGISRTSDRHQIEFFETILVRLCRAITGRHLLPYRVRFTHRRAHIPASIKALFGVGVEFGAKRDEVAFPASAMHLALGHRDPYLNSLLQRYCDDIVATRRARHGDWRTKVENVVAPLLPHGEATMQNVAQRIGVSVRTLARRLAAEKVTFVEILAHLRMELAKRYLDERELKVAEVAWLLGYKDASAFSHAFKRRTGASPKDRAKSHCRTERIV